MDAHGLAPEESVPASRKLGREDAAALAAKAKTIIVAKGKKVATFSVSKGQVPDGAVAAMLGPTGNLRAPTVRAGTTLLVGFDEEHYQEALMS
ncbi:MAG: hypothetical protein GKR94_29935 [Gammaproteobacteria bacterium]|nr:hypothetical protein [Gammaproteobacteria bacterium]